jgi:hypothetical protein
MVQGAAHSIVLRMPTIGETYVFVANPTLHRTPADQEVADRLQILDAIDMVDGAPASMEIASAITAEPAARDTLLAARADWLMEWRDAGIAYVQCPHCRRGEGDFTLAALAAALNAPRQPLVDAQGRLLPFCLSLPPPALGGAVGRLRFRLPSQATAAATAQDSPTGGILAPIDAEAEARAWQQFAPIGIDPPEEHYNWTFESAGFRAVLRMACALESLDALRHPDITPADVEPLPLGAFCFLDELYGLAFLTPSTRAVAVRCPACGQTLLRTG